MPPRMTKFPANQKYVRDFEAELNCCGSLFFAVFYCHFHQPYGTGTWRNGVEGMWAAAITHFILTADPDAAGRPPSTPALFTYFINNRSQAINNCFLLFLDSRIFKPKQLRILDGRHLYSWLWFLIKTQRGWVQKSKGLQDSCPNSSGSLYSYSGHCSSHLYNEILNTWTDSWLPAVCISDSSFCVSSAWWQNCKEFAKEECSEDILVEIAVNIDRTQNDERNNFFWEVLF